MKKSIFIIFLVISFISFLFLYQFKRPNHLYIQNRDENKIVFSVDDTIGIFKDLTENCDNYNSIFDNSILYRFKQLHDKYGFRVTFYVFYKFGELDEFDLSNATGKFKHEFLENSDWLKFGFHAYNSKSNYANTNYEQSKKEYEIVIEQLIRICGDASIDRNIRLHSFAGNFESINAMKQSKYGITGLYTADDNRLSYYLSIEENNVIKDNDYMMKDGLLYIHTDYRLEHIDNFATVINNISFDEKILTIFTHEWLLEDKTILSKIKFFCEYAVENGYNFSFLDNYN